MLRLGIAATPNSIEGGAEAPLSFSFRCLWYNPIHCEMNLQREENILESVRKQGYGVWLK